MGQDETRQVFFEDLAEKKSTARGARHRASRTGKLGKVNLPADFLGAAYTKSSRALSFSVDDVLYMLQETPTLKELLMQRLDAEYEHYKLAIERTLDAVARIQETALSAVLNRIQVLEEEILTLKNKKLTAERPLSLRAGRKSLNEIRNYVFPRIAVILEQNEKPGLKAVTEAFPGIRYYIYHLKVWPGFQEMLADFREWKNHNQHLTSDPTEHLADSTLQHNTLQHNT